jgi:hypothetical protein
MTAVVCVGAAGVGVAVAVAVRERVGVAVRVLVRVAVRVAVRVEVGVALGGLGTGFRVLAHVNRVSGPAMALAMAVVRGRSGLPGRLSWLSSHTNTPPSPTLRA